MKILKRLMTAVVAVLTTTAVLACGQRTQDMVGVIWGVTPSKTNANYHVDYPFILDTTYGSLWAERVAYSFDNGDGAFDPGPGLKNNQEVAIPFTVYCCAKRFVSNIPLTEIRLEYKIVHATSASEWKLAGVIKNPPAALEGERPRALFGMDCINDRSIQPGDIVALRLYITDGVHESGQYNSPTLNALWASGYNTTTGNNLPDQQLYNFVMTSDTALEEACRAGGPLYDRNGNLVTTQWYAVYVMTVRVVEGYRIER